MMVAAPMLALPAAAALAQTGEPPLPAPSGRSDVTIEGRERSYGAPVRRMRDDDPVAAAEDGAPATPAAPPAGKAEQPEGASAAKPPAATSEERGQHRASLLRRLQGGDVVALEADPGNPPTVTESLELVEAVAFALKNNFEVAASKAKTDVSRWELVGGFGQYLPRIDYTRRKGRERSAPAAFHNENGDTIPADHHDTSSRDISARQPVVDLAIVADVLGRWDALDATSAEELGVRERVALDTIGSFLRLVQSRLLITFATSYKDNLDKLAQRMGDRVSGGGASSVELERINARSVSARSAMIEARAEYRAALVEFRRLTGQIPQKLALPANLLPVIPEQVDEVLTRALRANPEYRAALLRVDAARNNAAKPFANMLPKLSIEFSDNRTTNAGGIEAEHPNNFDPVSRALYPQTNERRVMGVFSVTLNGGVDFAQGMANAAQARQAAAMAADSRVRLEENVRNGYSALSAADGRIHATSQAMESNTKVVSVFEEQYLAGGRQLLDLLDAYERLYQSQTELSRLVVSEASATFLVRRQMGELVKALMLGEQE